MGYPEEIYVLVNYTAHEGIELVAVFTSERLANDECKKLNEGDQFTNHDVIPFKLSSRGRYDA